MEYAFLLLILITLWNEQAGYEDVERRPHTNQICVLSVCSSNDEEVPGHFLEPIITEATKIDGDL